MINSLINTTDRIFGDNLEMMIKLDVFVNTSNDIISEEEKIRTLIKIIRENSNQNKKKKI